MSQLDTLIEIMEELREKCPWDKKQTIHSLRQMTIEETYELADAITTEDWKGIQEELGDLLLLIVFYATIAAEQQQFTIQQVIAGICKKLIDRHPHIYSHTMEGLQEVRSEEDVKKNWEQLKLREGKKSILSGVPRSLPAVVKAMRLQEKAKQVGFEWKHIDDVWAKVKEEMEELQQAIQENDSAKKEEELGDLFFALINYSRFLQVDAEVAVERTNKKFMERFMQIEAYANSNHTTLAHMTLEEMDAVWNQAKNK